eukprot:CAMPEP_0119553360 /NCGR_PEP_ID=MMETSP1352-20130426/6136_1 /TAXON_ID=265584 /ORGANISM="Stauroneis constricta, Strain CCMP1120" /LENGTH=37 /DNA_ID= /DNA_START= /DNA_END= /DNA_ORIENTATION=
MTCHGDVGVGVGVDDVNANVDQVDANGCEWIDEFMNE